MQPKPNNSFIRLALFLILSCVVIILTVTLLIERDISSALRINITDKQTTINQLTNENQELVTTILTMVDEVQLRNDITSVIIDASRAYNNDPMLLTQLIRSEGNFRPNVKHSLPYVQCMSGINVKAHPKTLHNPNSIVGCIYASSEILAKYINESDGLTLALTKYKGFSPLGHTQAKEVIKAYAAAKKE